jgi:hypothetical protein
VRLQDFQQISYSNKVQIRPSSTNDKKCPKPNLPRQSNDAKDNKHEFTSRKQLHALSHSKFTNNRRRKPIIIKNRTNQQRSILKQTQQHARGHLHIRGNDFINLKRLRISKPLQNKRQYLKTTQFKTKLGKLIKLE